MTIHIKSFKKGDPGWLELRARYITGTELSALFGLNRYSNIKQVMQNKITPAFVENVYTTMGKILEPAVLNSYMFLVKRDDVGLFSDGGSDNVMYYDDVLRMSATPDAYVGRSTLDIDFPVELKSTSPLNISKWCLDGSYPLNYMVQLASQCILLGKDVGHLSGMSPVYPNLPAIALEFHLTPELKSIIIEELERFWQEWSTDEDFLVSSSAKSRVTSLITSNTRVIATRGIRDTRHTPTETASISWSAL